MDGENTLSPLVSCYGSTSTSTSTSVLGIVHKSGC